MEGDPKQSIRDYIGASWHCVVQGFATYRNFAPRLGFAYGIRDNPRFGTVLRGGGGVFFDTGEAAAAAQAAQGTYPYESAAYLVNLSYSSINIGQLQGTAIGLPQYQVYLTDPNLRAPRTYNWSLTIEPESWGPDGTHRKLYRK